MKHFLLSFIFLTLLSCTSGNKEYSKSSYIGNNLWTITYTGSSLYTTGELLRINSELESSLRKSLLENSKQDFVILYVKNDKGEPSLTAVAKPFNSKKK